jgi:hypothetical protein
MCYALFVQSKGAAVANLSRIGISIDSTLLLSSPNTVGKHPHHHR